MNGSETSPLVYVVVLSWNGKEDTVRCLHSLAPVADRRIRVLLADNGSVDGTQDMVGREFPWVEISENHENLGYAGGNNEGIRYALGRGADYILLLNNDTVVGPDFVREMVRVMQSSATIGFVSPKIYFFDEPDRIWFAGARYSVYTGHGRVTGYREKDLGQYEQAREIGRPCGCALLVSRSVCQEVGLLDPGTFLYMDEIDWMLRARKKGYKAYLAPKAKVWHRVSSSAGGEDHPNAFYYSVRNTLHLLNAHARLAPSPLNWVRNGVVLVVFLLALAGSPAPKWEGIRAIADGVRDYLKGVRGARVQRSPCA